MTENRCPYCGYILSSFATHCPACNQELRNIRSSLGMQDFSGRLNAITDSAQRANFIRNYPIPNNREDILEFMIMASTHLKGDAYTGRDAKADTATQAAWHSLLEQCYHRGNLLLKDPDDLARINSIYHGELQDIENSRLALKGQKKTDFLNRLVQVNLPTASGLLIFICALPLHWLLPDSDFTVMMLLMGLGFMVVGAATTFRRRHGLADYLVTGICGVAACLMSLLFFRSDDAKIPLGAGIFVIVLTIPQALICIIRQKRK